MNRIVIACFLLMLSVAAAMAQDVEMTVERVIFHGNHSISDDELAGIAGVSAGMPLSSREISEIEERLLASGRLKTATVAVRYTTLDMSGPVVLVISVIESPSFSDKLLVLPLIGSFKGYGFSYGAQVTTIDLLGMEERVSLPFTWGGTKQAGLEIEFDKNLPFASYLKAGFRYLDRDEHRVLKESDDRLQVHGEIGWSLNSDFYISTSYLYEDITYADQVETTSNTFAATFAFDTRPGSLFPYDSVYAAYTLAYRDYDQLFEDSLINTFDVRLFKRVFGQSILAVQGVYSESENTQPIFNKAFLGGEFWIRGFDYPDELGDNFYIGTVELRIPLSKVTDPFNWGITAFYDYAGLWDVDQDRGDARIFQSTGFGGFVQLGAINIIGEIAVPTGDDPSDVRFHGGATFKF